MGDLSKLNPLNEFRRNAALALLHTSLCINKTCLVEDLIAKLQHLDTATNAEFESALDDIQALVYDPDNYEEITPHG